MSFYANYLTERTNDLILETEQGFVTYRYLDNNAVYIVDIFVIPEARKTKVATELADRVVAEAKEKGCTTLVGTVAPNLKNSTTSLKVLLGYGMSLNGLQNNLIVFSKEI